jgi:hypothetical protein
MSRTVGIRGWLWTDEMLAMPEVPARRGDHWNIEVQNHDLYPVSSLSDEIEAREILLNGNH